jgi:hypothetical protein
MMEQIEQNFARQKYKGVPKKWVIAGWITTLEPVINFIPAN